MLLSILSSLPSGNVVELHFVYNSCWGNYVALSEGDLCYFQNTTNVRPSPTVQIGSTIYQIKQGLLACGKNMQCNKEKKENLLFKAMRVWGHLLLKHILPYPDCYLPMSRQ